MKTFIVAVRHQYTVYRTVYFVKAESEEDAVNKVIEKYYTGKGNRSERDNLYATCIDGLLTLERDVVHFEI